MLSRNSLLVGTSDIDIGVLSIEDKALMANVPK